MTATRTENPVKSQPSNEQSNDRLLAFRRVPRCEIIDRGVTRKELRYEVHIYSSPERLWQTVLSTRKINMPKGFASTFGNELGHSSLVKVPFSLARSKGKLFPARLTKLRPGGEIGWKQRWGRIPGLFEWETSFQIIPHVDGTGATLVQTEVFNGLLLPLMKSEILQARREIQLRTMDIREQAENIS